MTSSKNINYTFYHFIKKFFLSQRQNALYDFYFHIISLNLFITKKNINKLFSMLKWNSSWRPYRSP